ncbi:MAG: DUF1501 domain-containing protein [Saprospiraceae bacterium]
MKRRSFLKYTSAVAVPTILGKLPVYAFANSGSIQLGDKIIILIQLNGGNDGLASLVPLDQYDNLANVRSNIIIPENKLLKINDTLALHPSLNGFRDLYDKGNLKIIQNVGYPAPNRSHFRSRDIWHTASDSNEIKHTGWLGRNFEIDYPNYPNNYPNSDFPDPFAVTMGNSVSETCQGDNTNYSMAVSNPSSINELNEQLSNESVTGCAIDNITHINNTIKQSNVYGKRMEEAYALGNNLSGKYDENDRLSIQLKSIARLISGGLQTQVYVASLGGFDTHADQVVDGDPSIGEHAQLMKILGDSISAFQDDLELLGIKEKVVGMTYSEFGRRIKSNDSFGTDHGDAAPLFVFGDCVDSSIHGNNPIITTDVDKNEAVAMETDFRSIYGSLLMDWVGISEDRVMELFPHNFQKISIANNCQVPNNVIESNKYNIKIYPNPSQDFIDIDSPINLGKSEIIIFNSVGKKLIKTKRIISAESNRINVSYLPDGNYYLAIKNKTLQITLPFVKF